MTVQYLIGMVITSAWHAGSQSAILGQGRHGNILCKNLVLILKTVTHGPVSVMDVKEPLRTTNTLAVTTLSFSIEMSAWQ